MLLLVLERTSTFLPPVDDCSSEFEDGFLPLNLLLPVPELSGNLFLNLVRSLSTSSTLPTGIFG